MYKLKLLEEAEEWLFDLPKDQRNEILVLIDMLKKLGYELNYPYSRQLKGTKQKVKELRCQKFGNRLYYVHHEDKIYVGLLGGNKGTQTRDIKKADKKARQIKMGKVVI